MNLETKITIYKFTPQVFTLTPKTSFCNCGLHGCQLRAVQPADGNVWFAVAKRNFSRAMMT